MPTAPAKPESWQDEVYRLGREALGRGSFETASRLLGLLEGDPHWAGDSRFVFNRAQAARYLNDAGEAAYWYGRYLAIEPNAVDAKAVREQVVKLVKAAPRSLRLAALRRAQADWDRMLADPELERALRESPQLRLEVRFVRTGAAAKPGEPQPPAFVFPGRAVFWRPPATDTAAAGWEVWAAPLTAVAPPEGLGVPPLLFLPPGRPFPLEMGPDLVSQPKSLVVEPPPFFPEDPDLGLYRVEVTAEVERIGPRLLLVGTRPGDVMVEVRSGPLEGPLLLGKKRRELPLLPTPLSFGPRPPRPDSKLFPSIPLAVLDIAGAGGSVQRWGAPVGAFDVMNRFGKLLPGDPERLTARADGTGPALTALRRSKR